MKVVIIGGWGTIGQAVANELKSRHEVIIVGHSKGDYTCDITSLESLDNLFQKLKPFDAVVSATGKIHFEPFSKMTPDKYMIGLKDKLMGQVNIVLTGKKYINDNGSFTLTSGILSEDPIVTGTSGSMVNAALNGFVIGAAIELERGIRINAVSPTVLTESLKQYGSYFRGYESAPASRVALAYSKSVEGKQTGKIYRVG